MRNGRVVELEISERLLEGGIPKVVGNLGALERLNLSRNRLSGEIPEQLGNLVNLRTLALNGKSDLCHYPDAPYEKDARGGIISPCAADRLSGEIPEQLGNLEDLNHLFVHENDLEGALPHELGNAENLKQVNFSGTYLTGCLPPNLQRHYGTPIMGQFLAEVSHAVAWFIASKAVPVISGAVSVVDFLTGGKISDMTGWVMKGGVRWISELFKEGARDSDLGPINLYCE